MRIPSIKLLAFRTLSVLLPLAALALGAEVILRLHTPRVVSLSRSGQSQDSGDSDRERVVQTTAQGRRLIPNTHVKILNHVISHRNIDMNINSLGFRGPEIALPKPASTFRVLALGDSITWGDYLQESETFPKQAERYLNEAHAPVHFEVINAGIGDVGTREEVDLLEDSGIKLQPDLVVLCFYLNDSRPPWGFAHELGHRGWLRRHSELAEWIYSQILLHRWVQKQGSDRFQWVSLVNQLPWRSDRNAFLYLAGKARYDWGAAWQPDSWDRIDREFSRLRSLSERYNFQVMVLVLPVLYQVEADYLEAFPQWAIRQLTRTYGFELMDILPTLRKHNKEYLYYDQCHMVPVANAHVGEFLAKFILGQYDKLIGIGSRTRIRT